MSFFRRKKSANAAYSNESHSAERQESEGVSSEIQVEHERKDEVQYATKIITSNEKSRPEIPDVNDIDEEQDRPDEDDSDDDDGMEIDSGHTKTWMEKEFPKLKIANKVSPNDRFFQSLQKDKAKIVKQNQVSSRGEEPISESTRVSRRAEVRTETTTIVVTDHIPRVSSPLKNSAISLDPDEASRSRDPSPTPVKRHNGKRNGTLGLPEALKKIRLIREDEAEEMFKDSSPIRPPQEDTDDVTKPDLGLARNITLIHDDESGKMFQDSQPFDKDDYNTSDLLDSQPNNEDDECLNMNDAAVSKQLEPVDVAQLQEHILNKLSGESLPSQLFDLDDQYQQLHRLITNTITNQEGNSCLLIGPSGTGKNSTIRKVLDDLNCNYPKQFLTVRLSGSVQHDEKAAIRSIAQQIDTGIAQYGEPEKDALKITDSRSSNRTLRALLKVLDQNSLDDLNLSKSTSLNSLSIAVVFVIDEFHKFTEYNRQSLLYNLLDLSQNSYTPIAVVGVTAKVNTREMLEKRVKSRFSQKIVLFNKPQFLEEFIEQFLCNATADPDIIDNNEYAQAYNEHIIKAAKTVTSALHRALVINFYTIKSLNDALISLMPVVLNLSAVSAYPDYTNLLQSEDPYSTELSRKIESLSDLELTLLLACCRIVAKSDLNIVDLNTSYNEYVSCMKSLKAERISSMTSFESGTGVVLDSKIYSKKNIKKRWESLQQLGLLVLHNPGLGSNTAKKISQNASFTTFSLVITLEELRKMIDKQSQLYYLTNL